LAEILADQADFNGNVTVGDVRAIDTRRAFVYSPDKLVALIGLEDVIIIDTPDALLIADRSRSDEVKKIVENLQAQGRTDLL
jgi:mannose-1-phosphate guanylyltransferase